MDPAGQRIFDLFFFDGTTTRQVTTGGYRGASLGNGRIALTLFDGNDTEVCIWENGALTRLTNNTTDDFATLLDGAYLLLWTSDSAGPGFFLWDGTAMRRVTDSTFAPGSDVKYDIYQGAMWAVWTGPDPKGGQDKEVFLFDGAAVRQLTANRLDESTPFIHDGQVAWNTYDGSDWEVYVWNGSATYRLTDNTTQDFLWGINNGQVAWSHWDNYPPGYSDYEIFLATPK